MGDHTILIKFDGRDADQHTVDMRLLGQSLQGFDKIISDGIIFLSENRLPRKRERAIIKVKALPPREGSQEIPAILQESAGILALGWQLYNSTEGKIIWHWVSFVLNYFGGRKSNAEVNLQAMLDMTKLHLDARDKADEAWRAHSFKSDEAWREHAYKVVDRLAPAAALSVAPVGPSVRDVGVGVGGSEMMMVDEPMAETIRSKEDLDLGDLRQMTLATDGFSFHSRTLKVVHPEDPGRFLSASVKDPAFDQTPNPYTDAASECASIVVMAKGAYRNGQLERLYIMDFIERVGT